MIVTKDGYSVVYRPKSNQIVIGLPQTMHTVTNTVSMVVNRKTDINDDDLLLLVEAARYMLNDTPKMVHRSGSKERISDDS